MGKMKEHPRYNIMSFRASAELEKRVLDACRKVGITKSQLLSELVEKGLGVNG